MGNAGLRGGPQHSRLLGEPRLIQIESFNKTVRFKGEPIAPLPCAPSKSIDDTTCINIRFASLALTLSQLLVTLCGANQAKISSPCEFHSLQ